MTMRYAIIQNGVVVNVAVSEQALESNWIASETAAIGDLYDGQSFTRPQQPDPVPEVVSMRQARLALLQADLLDDVETAMASASRADQIEWEYATEVRRDSALVVSMTAALGWSSTQVDNLFRVAQTL